MNRREVMSTNTLQTLGGGRTMTPTGMGLLAGCKILTIEAYTAITDLKPGARIVTRSGLRRLRH